MSTGLIRELGYFFPDWGFDHINWAKTNKTSKVESPQNNNPRGEKSGPKFPAISSVSLDALEFCLLSTRIGAKDEGKKNRAVLEDK